MFSSSGGVKSCHSVSFRDSRLWGISFGAAVKRLSSMEGSTGPVTPDSRRGLGWVFSGLWASKALSSLPRSLAISGLISYTALG